MKKSGVALLATIISIAVLLLVSGGFFTIMASNTGLIKSGGESLQAQYFAQLEADTIKMLSYDEVDNITQDTWQEFDIDNSWQYKVNVGPEQNVGDSDNTIKIASISVRKNGDTINRFALDVPLSSQGSGRYIKESYYAPDGSTWYRLYSDGWCEQGGTVCASGSYTMAIVNFPKKFVLGYIPFATAKYIHAPEYECAQTGYTTVRFDFHTSAFITSLTNEQMKFGNGGQNDGGLVAYVWYACGVTA